MVSFGIQWPKLSHFFLDWMLKTCVQIYSLGFRHPSYKIMMAKHQTLLLTSMKSNFSRSECITYFFDQLIKL